MQTDNSLRLPSADAVQNMDDVRDWMRKASGLLNSNQSDVYQDLIQAVDTQSDQSISGTKVFSGLTLGAEMDCNQKQMVSMVIENRTSDPSSPVEGQIWLRTDLLP